jgi:hypothetical protein
MGILPGVGEGGGIPVTDEACRFLETALAQELGRAAVEGLFEDPGKVIGADADAAGQIGRRPDIGQMLVDKVFDTVEPVALCCV